MLSPGTRVPSGVIIYFSSAIINLDTFVKLLSSL
jgi:hypothetical protein